jgi:4-hydroxythreonine-4-phosphate dehydrogenase
MNRHDDQPLPIIAITVGDPAGVGPEIIVKALHDPEIRRICRPVVIGDASQLARAAEICRLQPTINRIADISEARYELDGVDCVDLGLVPDDLPFGELAEIAGEAAYRAVEIAARLALTHEVAAICTAPLNKEALHIAGHFYPGHTEMLAALTDTPEVSMMLTSPRVRVVHVTTHIGLRDAIDRIEPGLVFRTIQRGHAAILASGTDNPRIAVCGINPHAGEHGLFGHREEEEKIAPGVENARQVGIAADGPLPADTVFFRASRGDFDLVVAMYHDQGHGPVKVQGLEAGVNITLGLPVIRTSVDHGTAFDIAGTGVADHRSMIEALRTAAELAEQATTSDT